MPGFRQHIKTIACAAGPHQRITGDNTPGEARDRQGGLASKRNVPPENPLHIIGDFRLDLPWAAAAGSASPHPLNGSPEWQAV